MPKISILSESLINKIAAGEIIERPASVVRELIDNSIDAGADRIGIEVLYGGKKLIRVSDNGAGMDRDDAVLSLERHATSKISSENDLMRISTLGFRGEALPAIAAVSKIILITSQADSGTGVRVEIGVDRKKEITDAPPLRGTVVEVRDLFFNTPARRKFLKSISTELSHIIETVIQKAFAYPNIAFSLTHNSSEVLNAPPAVDLRERFVQLYGEEFTDEFLEVRREDREIKIRGFSSKENFLRTNRSYQNIFVNRRPVKNSTISHAVYSAYEGLLPKERHPAYFLFLDIDPARVDVNVHPAKREVRFESPDRIHDIVKSAIRQTLGRTEEGRKHEYRTVPPPGFNLQDTPVNYGYGSDMLSDSQAELFTLEEALSISSFFHIGEAFIAMVTDNGLLLIDQHAAHERILYDRFLRGIDIETEAFFLPVRVELPVREYNILIKHRALLHDTGVEIEEFGANSLVIRAVPKELKGADLKGLLMDIAAGIIEEETSGIKDATGRQGLLRSIAQRLACHRAVRGAEHLSSAELRRMLSDLDKTEEPDRCPHGRPTRILISMNDLKRMFKRR